MRGRPGTIQVGRQHDVCAGFLQQRRGPAFLMRKIEHDGHGDAAVTTFEGQDITVRTDQAKVADAQGAVLPAQRDQRAVEGEDRSGIPA